MNAMLDPYVACLKERPAATMRLLCFPHAGGSLLTYAPWVETFEQRAPLVELWAVQLPPGPFDSFESVTEQLAQALAAQPKRTMFFGHSLGGLLAFGTARALRMRGAELPEALIVASTTAPQAERLDACAACETWTRAEWRSYLGALGGVAQDALEDASRLDEIADEMRHELELRRMFRYVSESPFAFPIAAYGGVDENVVDELLAWRERSSADFTLRLWPGGHFFLHDEATREPVLRALTSDLLRWL